MTGIDLFSGCGGLTLGFLKAGFNVLAGVDNDPNACETYFRNLHEKVSYALVWDLFEHPPKDFFNHTGLEPDDIDVVIGGPPCGGFSVAGNRRESDKRNNLVDVFLDWVDYIAPRAVLMENVPGIASMYKGRVANHVRGRLSKNYDENMKVLNAAEYGVPQNRERAIFIGADDGTPSYPPPDHGVEDQTKPTGSLKPAATVEEAIGDLPSLSAGERSEIPNHEARDHGDEQIEKMSHIGQSENWESLPEKYRKGKNCPSHFYHRLVASKPSRILPSTASSTSILHPKEDRQITVREFARLQSFPDDYVFYGTKSSRYRQVGDAVPPLLAEKLARELKKTLVV